jgi:threonine/homoserine efflux transporter RhtA
VYVYLALGALYTTWLLWGTNAGKRVVARTDRETVALMVLLTTVFWLPIVVSTFSRPRDES